MTLCLSQPPMMQPTTYQGFNPSEEHVAPLPKLAEEKEQQSSGAGGTGGDTNRDMGDTTEDTHRKTREEACEWGYFWVHGRRHSWKEDLHAGGGASLRDCDHRQPTLGQGHPKGLWLWVTHTRTGATRGTTAHGGGHSRADKNKQEIKCRGMSHSPRKEPPGQTPTSRPFCNLAQQPGHNGGNEGSVEEKGVRRSTQTEADPGK